DIRTVLDQHFARLTKLEQQILFWLAVEREPTAPHNLRDSLLQPPQQRDFVEALRKLQRHSLVEKQGVAFGLQNVVTEYLTERLIEQVCRELHTGQLDLVYQHALLKAQTKENIRQSQERLIVAPIARHLSRILGQQGLTERLQHLLRSLSDHGTPMANYAGGNMLNLLVHLEIDMRGFDFSQLTLREAYLQDASLIDTNFMGAEFINTVFTSSFGPVFWVTVSSDDQLMAAAFDNGEIGLWRLPNAQQVRLLVGHERRVRWVTFSPDNRRLVSASLDHTVRLWDVETGHCLQTICTHQKGVHTVVFSPDGRYIASGGQDHLVYLWDMTSGQLLTTLRGHSDWINAIAFHPHGHLLASASHDNTIRLWQLPTNNGQLPTNEGPLLGILEGQFRIVALAFSPDGTLLASGAGDSTVRIWDVESQRAVQTLHGHTGWVRGVAFSPDGSLLASGATDQLIRVWAVPGWHVADVLHGHMDEIASLTFNADGKMLISSAGQEIKLWDLRNPRQGQAIRTLRGGIRPINCVIFSPDGSLIASGHRHGAVHLWRVAQDGGSALFQRVMLGHVGIVTSIAFSPDGTTLASAGHDGSIRLWDVGSGACLAVLLHRDNS
ncbi:MAG: hypothetical protein KDE47_34675, partial [Caldilineaceae bacterium]|nr:hypothetical protein [Caldilineaceae bacterium]